MPGCVVVGVDGSRPASSALRFAIEEAHRRTARLRVITAYWPPELWPLAYGAPITISDEQIADHVRQETKRLVDEVLAGDPQPPPIDIDVTADSAASALIDASKDADLLVVGHRGRGGFASMLLGSVGLQCVLHAECPVTVVRPAKDAEDKDPAKDTEATEQR